MNAQPQLQLARGVVRTIRHQKPESGWGICELLKQSGETLALTGVLPALLEVGDTIEAIGALSTHPKYGEQFKSVAVVLHLRGRVLERKAWISSLKLAVSDQEQLVNLGGRLWDVLENSQLSTIELTEHGRLAVTSAYQELAATRAAFLALLNFGFDEKLTSRFIHEHGANAVQALRENPYLPFVSSPVSCPFKLIDQIAREHFGVLPNDERRIDAVAVHELRKDLQKGHCYNVLYTVADRCVATLGLDVNEIKAALMKAQRSVVVEPSRIALRYVHNWEVCAGNVAGMLADKVADDATFSSTLARVSDLQLDASQTQAVQMLLSAPICVVTGAAGTGKTTILREAITHLGGNFVLCAPTGKAARRITEATGYPAVTIHRLLEANYSGVFHRDAGHPVDASVILCDESSMISIDLAAALLSATSSARIAFIGDANQLPPVGPGQFFCDLILSEVVPVVKLDYVHRAATDTWIYKNAPKVLAGEPLDLDEDRDDFLFYEADEDGADLIAGAVVDIMKQHLEDGHKLNQIQVITGQHDKAAGRTDLNQTLQPALNTSKSLAWKVFGSEVRVGDPVVQQKNNYALDVFNGEVGIVQKVGTNELVVRFDDRFVTYTRGLATQLDLAYALTIHRFQGSQVDTAVVVCHSSQARQLRTRQLFYTAITRAKRKVILVGDRKGIVDALRNNQIDTRRTTLVQRLRTIAPGAA